MLWEAVGVASNYYSGVVSVRMGLLVGYIYIVITGVWIS